YLFLSLLIIARYEF
ncbi:hypothetical protein D050_0488B, partial [Vibrio parahaemolyticus VPCR-2009]